ncbi:MAG: hypothetical protein AAB646_00985 [Patescibacteria group bacterium]
MLWIYCADFSFFNFSHKSVEEQQKPQVQQITVELDPVKWSEWVKLPPNHWFQIDFPNWIECKFWDGRVVKALNGKPQWVGKINNNIFRLRGCLGTATITLEPK